MNKNTAYIINLSSTIIAGTVARKVLFPKGDFQGRWFARQLRLSAVVTLVNNIVAPVVVSQVDEADRAEAALMSGSPAAMVLCRHSL